MGTLGMKGVNKDHVPLHPEGSVQKEEDPPDIPQCVLISAMVDLKHGGFVVIAQMLESLTFKPQALNPKF